MIFDFIAGGTGTETAEERNCEALGLVQLQPRTLRNVENIQLDTEFMGEPYGRPYGVAPMGMCNLIAPGADEVISREAAHRNFPHCVSTAASSTMETSFDHAQGRAWFQLLSLIHI